ncbi:MAG: hypothetical protein R2879_06800 [Saprospiraceae bacterium]
MKKEFQSILVLFLSVAILSVGCKKDDPEVIALNPDTAPKVSVDRFSADAGMLMVRNSTNGLPGPNEPINFDSGAPFITKGFGPDGSEVEYYNFDVQSTVPAPIYLFFDENDEMVEGQLNIINVIPGDGGYNDFWQVYRVSVPNDYTANSITNEADLLNSDYNIEKTSTIVNCPVVPDGSTANKRIETNEDNGLHRGWYRDQVVYYFSFFEKVLDGGSSNMVPLSPIYVTFNINPDNNNPMSGPASGFMNDNGQTHNVLGSIPSDANYSPLWLVNVYDNNDFNNVSNLMDAQNANVLATGVANVNCPVVSLK